MPNNLLPYACPCFCCISFAEVPNRCRLAYGAAGGAQWGESVRDFRMVANRSRRVMRKCQTCIQPMVKGAHHALVSCNNNERESERVNGKKKTEISIWLGFTNRCRSAKGLSLKSSVSGLWSWVGARSHSICLPHLVQNGMCHHLPCIAAEFNHGRAVSSFAYLARRS